MSRLHGLMVSLLLAACVVAGATAATNTIHIGQAAAKPPHVPDALIAARRAKLDAFAQSLRKARDAKPPALPAVPTYAPVAIPTVPPAPAPRVLASQPAPTPAVAPATTPAAQAQPPVRYVRPAPIVKYVQPNGQPATSSGYHGDDGGGDGGGFGGDDGSSGGDN